MPSPVEPTGFWDFVEQFQTLIAGTLAIIAAVGAIWVTNLGIRQTRHLAQSDRQRDLAAARGVLPLALSALTDYAEQCAKRLRDLLKDQPGDDPDDMSPVSLPDELTFPEIPADSVAVFRDCIRSASPPVEHALVELLRKLQIQHSRLRGIRSKGQTVARQYCYALLFDVVELHARTAGLFKFARGIDESPKSEPAADDLQNAKLNLELFDGEFAGFDRFFDEKSTVETSSSR